VQDDNERPKGPLDLDEEKIETLIAGIMQDVTEIGEIVKRIKRSPSLHPEFTQNMPGIEKKLYALKNLLKSIDGFDRVSSSLPMSLFPALPSHIPWLTSFDAFMQMPSTSRIEFKGPYCTLNELFNQGISLGTIIEFYTGSLAGIEACSTCTFIIIDAYMRSDAIDMKSVRFVTADPLRYGTLFKKLEPVIGQDMRVDCIKVAAIDTIQDARALLENPALMLDVPKNGLVVINCIDTIIALLGYDNSARRDRLKAAMFQALRQMARDTDAVVIVTSLIPGKPRQAERETCDYMASVEPQSAKCIKFRVLGRGQAYIIKRNETYMASEEPIEFADHAELVAEAKAEDRSDVELMDRVEAFRALILRMQDEGSGEPVAIDLIVERARLSSVAANLAETELLLNILKKMQLIADHENGTVTAVQ
jgi:hypothetical protein